MDFKQVHISFSIREYFGEPFKAKWNLTEYHDKTKPAVFLGLGTKDDIIKLRNHESYSIIIWAGGEFTPELVSYVHSIPLTIQVGYGWMVNTYKQLKVPYTELYIPIKDYSMFHPSPLGDKIYVYKGIHGNRSSYFQWDSIVQPLINYYGQDRIIYTSFQPIDKLINEYYNNSFIYVKPNDKGGSTTMWELGLMGRRTISNNQGNIPSVLNYNSVNDIITHINNEMQYIGTIQYDVSNNINNTLIQTNNWLNLDFYEKHLL